ncbi:MAG: hypothetical protein IKW51_06295 [Bacteroidales bacterium]|nr:hypothetical protein [Bacteroidales bacterium]
MKKTFLTLMVVMLFVTTVSAQQIYNVKTSDKADGRMEHSIGTITLTGEVLNGMKTGTWIENFPNTELPHYIIQYQEGKKNGLYMEFNKEGYIIKKIDYKNDLIDGTLCEWARSGLLLKKQEYKGGQLDGRTVICYDNGFLQEESEYKEGKKHGVTVWYSYANKAQGPKAVMYTYVDGQFEGPQEVYYESGYLKSVKMFSGNVANGAAVELYEDGSIKSECTYKNGEMKGKVKEYKQGAKFLD